MVLLFMPVSAGAVSAADEEYAAVLRLKPRIAHGAKLFELCAACHGKDGDGSADGSVPAIAGQFMPVLVKQLIEFRYGERHSIRAEGFVADHRPNAQDLADAAAYVSSLEPRTPPVRNDLVQTAYGATLFENLCASCHGSRGDGDRGAHVPRLAGQHSEYLAEQMREATHGGRPGMERDHARLFAKLGIDDVNALARYLAEVAPARAGR
ncbi:MAG: c-type cytochrome [Steroidobacteraceae bacterium]